jgi:hypothetical protein
MSVLLNIAVGSVVMFAFLAVMLGGISNAVSFFVLAAVCTAGVGLVMWAGLAWGIGWVVVAVVRSASGRSAASV